MAADRITRLLIGGMRCIAEIKLDLGAFTVLIGENGAGKSTIVEALELLRKAAVESPFVEKLYLLHGGTRLLRSGAGCLRLGARIEGAGPALVYEIQVLRDGTYLGIQAEMGGGARSIRVLRFVSRNATRRFFCESSGCNYNVLARVGVIEKGRQSNLGKFRGGVVQGDVLPPLALDTDDGAIVAFPPDIEATIATCACLASDLEAKPRAKRFKRDIHERLEVRGSQFCKR